MALKNAQQKILLCFKGMLGYGTYVLFNIVFMLYACAVAVLTLPFPGLRRKILSLSLLKTLRLMLWIMDAAGVAKFKSMGDENIPSQAAVYVSNHKSLLDSVFMLSRIPRSGVIVKTSYMPLLAIGVLVKLFDFVAIDKNSKDSLLKARIKCEKLLSEGVSIIVFPEGTRNSSKRMLEFGSLAFRLAAENSVPLVPASIFQKGSLLSKDENSFFPPQKDSFTLSFLKPIMPPEFKTPDDLLNRAHRQIMRETARLKQEAEA